MDCVTEFIERVSGRNIFAADFTLVPLAQREPGGQP
jgi:hypothetical protein